MLMIPADVDMLAELSPHCGHVDMDGEVESAELSFVYSYMISVEGNTYRYFYKRVLFLSVWAFCSQIIRILAKSS